MSPTESRSPRCVDYALETFRRFQRCREICPRNSWTSQDPLGFSELLCGRRTAGKIRGSKEEICPRNSWTSQDPLGFSELLCGRRTAGKIRGSKEFADFQMATSILTRRKSGTNFSTEATEARKDVLRKQACNGISCAQREAKWRMDHA